ncbi:DNA-binding protein [Micromonospora sp. S4605]|uniref:helix-turn-helix transcriptional regulator n=1 Tax=Micromonospora sp. S4605 TaxID=1420897 RepID=UPI000D70023C|nr:helix-turn-helix domain-containing protein [Micromonospora sp. S4605]PWU45497.1 DNA-binding protein [Micromonospora sp. S4605]
MTDRRPLATSAEVGAYLGVPIATLDKWVVCGTGPRFAKVGRHRRYRWADVEKWLNENSSSEAA